MTHSLRRLYGTRVGQINGADFYAFPTLNQLSTATETHLRSIGFGYRSAFVVESVRQLISKGGETYLTDMRGRQRHLIESELTTFHGVGSKVAACIALFALDSLDTVPVDTHVLQLALRHYHHLLPDNMSHRSLTPRVHLLIGDMFRQCFGEFAGWAHTVLFAAELAHFKDRLTVDPVTTQPKKRLKKQSAVLEIDQIVVPTSRGVRIPKRQRRDESA